MKRLGAVFCGSMVAFCASAAFAQTKPKFVMDVSTGGTVESNPYIQNEASTLGSASIAFGPRLSFVNGMGTGAIDGNFRITRFTNRFGSDISARVSGSIAGRLDERTTANMRFGFQTTRSSILDSVLLGAGNLLDPNVTPQVPVIDTTLAGQREPVQTYNVALGFSHSISPLTTMSFQANSAYTAYHTVSGIDRFEGGGQLSFSRRLSPHRSLNFSLGANYVDYVGRPAGDSILLTPNIGFTQQLARSLSLTASTGFSFSRIKQLDGTTSTSFFYSANFSLCRRNRNFAICATASHGAHPTSIGNIGSTTTVSLSFSLHPTNRDNLSLSGRYGRTAIVENGVFVPDFLHRTEIAAGSLNYSHRFSDRVSFYIRPSYTKVYDNVRDRKANYGISGGFSFRLGQIR